MRIEIIIALVITAVCIGFMFGSVDILDRKLDVHEECLKSLADRVKVLEDER